MEYMMTEEMRQQFAAAAEGRPVIPAMPATEATHIGDGDLPYLDIGDGSRVQLLHVDFGLGLWVTKTRLKPGTRVSKHYHTGPVFAVTLKGQWYYAEYPDHVNSPGSYLFEPAGSIHSLCTPDDQEGDTEVWFAIYGANLNIDDSGNVLSVVDAPTVYEGYKAFCAALGVDCSKILVGQEPKQVTA